MVGTKRDVNHEVHSQALGRPRVAILANMLPPYRVPLYHTLEVVHGLDVTVLVMAYTEANRLWHTSVPNDLRVRVIAGYSLYVWRWELPIHINIRVEHALDQVAPDAVVIGGWDQLAYWRALGWARTRGIPAVLQNESGAHSARHLKGPLAWAKRMMVASSSAFVAYGSAARDYLLMLGAPIERIHMGINTVDVDSIAHVVEAYRQSLTYRDQRSRLGDIVFLYVGQLIPRKGVDVLLRAFAHAGLSRASLLVVGTGPEENALRSLSLELGLRNVTFLGFHQPHELWQVYALADALVLPSRKEVWGLVVNEAVAGGLYVICSDRVGAARDVICRGWNGDVVPVNDVAALAAALRNTYLMIDVLRERREAIMGHARSRLGIGQLASALGSAIKQAVQPRGLHRR